MERDFLIDIKLPDSDEIVKEHVTAEDDVDAMLKIARKYNERGIKPQLVKFHPVASIGPQAHA